MSFLSYPPKVYTGREGEVSADFRPADTAPDIGQAGKDAIHYLATTVSTHGEFGLYRVEMSPRAGGPSTHFHRTVSESFFILEGTVSLFDGERWIDATKGDFLYVPQGGLHAFRNDSDEHADMLMIFTPGAPREEYFERIAEVMVQGTPEERVSFLEKHDSCFVD
jgi:mannose-6-phosphate isomerase-like protein (cupin superfamily)